MQILTLARAGSVSLAAALAAGAAVPAFAQSVPLEFSGPNGSSARFYGQINQGFLYYDDGGESETFAPVDNDNSSTRFGVEFEYPVGNWVIGGTAEAEYQVRPSNKVSQTDRYYDDGWKFDEEDIRKVEIYFATPYGKLSLGQGSMATDGIAEIDLSGTGVIAYSSVADTAGGQFFRTDAGDLTDITVGSVFDNLDGSRRFRVRYDTPTYAGFTLSAAYGQEVIADGDDDDYYDFALRYANVFGDFETEAGVGYGFAGDDVETLSGSASVMHTPTGLNLTVAAGEEDQDGGDSLSYGYIKAGLQRDFFAFGATAFSVDYYGGDMDLGESWGLAAVQNFDAQNLEVYGTVRNYSYDGADDDLDDGLAVFSGVRWKF